MVGCGMLGKQAEMSESSVEETAIESDMKGDTAEVMVEAAIEEVTLSVTGMTWGACTSAVQDALSQVTGVSEVVSVSMAENQAVVKVEKGKVATEDLIKAVEADQRFKAKAAQ